MVRPTTCGPNRAKFSAHTRESTESSPPSWPCSLRQLRSGNCHPKMAVKIAMPSASADWGPAMPSIDTDMPSTTLVISGSSPARRSVRPLMHRSERAARSLHAEGAVLRPGDPHRQVCGLQRGLYRRGQVRTDRVQVHGIAQVAGERGDGLVRVIAGPVEPPVDDSLGAPA